MNYSIARQRATLNSNDENIDAKYLAPSELKEESVSKMRSELQETKDKLWTISQKFTAVRKERDALKKENKELQEEIMLLQNSMREMIPGFSNTSSMFPMYNELQIMVSDFLKCNCEDILLDILIPKQSMETVTDFFRETIRVAQQAIAGYFEPTFAALRKSTCSASVDGPLLSVLKKSYQGSWKQVFAACFSPAFCELAAERVHAKMRLGNGADSARMSIKDYMKKLFEVFLLCKVNEPELVFEVESIGARVQFNASKHESMDGFVKNKELAVIVFPPVRKGSITGEAIIKARVLASDYQFA